MEQIINTQINYDAHAKIASDVEKWLANGGQITQLSKSSHAAPDYRLFDKPKAELAQIARRERRSFKV